MLQGRAVPTKGSGPVNRRSSFSFARPMNSHALDSTSDCTTKSVYVTCVRVDPLVQCPLESKAMVRLRERELTTWGANNRRDSTINHTPEYCRAVLYDKSVFLQVVIMNLQQTPITAYQEVLVPLQEPVKIS